MKRHRSLNTLLIICCTWFIAFSTPSLHALLASSKAAGMALTAAAYPQDALAGVFNPAGITDVGDRIDLGFSWDHFEGQASVAGNVVPAINGTFHSSQAENYYSPDFGINKTFCLCDDWELAAGFVAYNRDFLKTSYTRPFPILGTSKLGLELIREAFSPVVAIKWCDRHSLGISLNVFAQRLLVKGIQNFDNARFSSDPGSVTNRGYDYSAGVGVTIGWKSCITDWLDIGIAYSPRASMSRFERYSGFLAEHGKLDVPGNLLGGIALRIIPCSTITFDVNYIDWARVRSLHNDLSLTKLATTQLGNKDGIGFGWKSQTIYRVGIDYQICDAWTVRAGYRYGNSPIRSTQTAVNLLSLETVEQYVTVGATWAFCDCMEVSAYYAHGFEHIIHGRGSIPVTFGGGDVNLKLHREVAGLSIGYCY